MQTNRTLLKAHGFALHKFFNASGNKPFSRFGLPSLRCYDNGLRAAREEWALA